MIPRRFLDLTRKPLSAFQTFFRQEKSINYQRPSLQTTQEESHYEENSSNQQEQDQKYQNNSNSDYNNYGRFMGFGAILPLFAVMTHKLNTVSCFFGGSKLESNKLTSRISLVQYPSNNPIEDRWAVQQLEAIPGYVTMVFDGHGGWQVAEFARENLGKELEKALKANKEKSFASEEEYIKASILEAFDRVEEDFLKMARDAYNNGFAGTGKVGACALVTLVTGNKVYVANAGDCQGVITRNDQGKFTLQRLNSKLNANSKKEQKRLREQFQDEDIVYCKRGDNKACYVKRRLQPTRAFGDFHLKHEEFNNPKGLGSDLGYRSRLENFRGPYITHVPVIKVFDLTPNDKYMILSSDGMWDELSKDDVAKLSEKNQGDKQKFTTELLNNALKVAAARIRVSEDELRNIPVGHRRNYHDDMTIIVVDLEGQAR